ncbi:MAG TPA: M20/M25/M40 family metallo-hydrolase [Thermomicrobiaceae bacterium]|nr:M20/M25/M40 family metallo-hydrolase [Thermomicrobiaceae bacterium]
MAMADDGTRGAREMQEMLDAIDVEELAGLTARLVAVRSYPGDEGAAQQAVADWLRGAGLAPELQPTAGQPNVVARVDNGPGPTLLLNGHVDTVLEAEGWQSDPWQPRRDGDRLYGLGACDMKSGLAAAMVATRELARHRDRWRGTVLFSSVVDEEAYSVGARALVASGLRADACLVAESEVGGPVIGATGKVLVRVDVTGKAAHGFWPREGINAAVEAARLVARLDELPLGTHPRLTPSQCVLAFQSGSAQYVITVPEHARVTINRLIVPGETGETVLAGMRALAEGLDSPARIAFAIDPPYYPPWETPRDDPFVQTFAAAYEAEGGAPPRFHYSTGVADSNLFAHDLGIPTVQAGARGGNIHQANEWVDVPSIARAARVFLRTALGTLR